VKDYASQRAGADNNCLSPEISFAGTDVDRCAVKQFPIDIR
jgi:hypothetical protein